jgi:hypothetical protein
MNTVYNCIALKDTKSANKAEGIARKQRGKGKESKVSKMKLTQIIDNAIRYAIDKQRATQVVIIE